MATSSEQLFKDGMSSIRRRLDAAVRQKGFNSIVIWSRARDSEPGQTTFLVSANGQNQEFSLSRAEILESAQEVGKFAMTKIRVVVKRLDSAH